MPRELTIVGGGLAGLALGIALRDAGVPVTLIEAGHYPRHRVCGEFISGRGQQVLSRLGLEERLAKAGMIAAMHTQFFAGRGSTPLLKLPEPAWSISRHALDAILADCFQERGGHLRTGTRWTADYASEGVVRATGRKPRTAMDGKRWLGLKAHADHVSTAADLEFHVTPTGYVGLSRLAGGRSNVCGLFRVNPSRPDDVFELLRGPAGSALRERLSQVEWVEGSRCSTGGLAFGMTPDSAGDCVVGDAFALIPPFTGNGMSMALESASLAAGALREYAFDRADWAQTRHTLRAMCLQQFRGRLWWGRWLHEALAQPWCAPLAILAIRGGGFGWRTAFHRTRC